MTAPWCVANYLAVIVLLLHGRTLCGDGRRVGSDFAHELDCLSNKRGVVGVAVLILLGIDKSLNLEETVLEVVVIGLEAVLQISTNVITLGAKRNIVAVMVFNAHSVLLALASHIGIGALVGINPNPLEFDSLKVSVVNRVLLADLKC